MSAGYADGELTLFPVPTGRMQSALNAQSIGAFRLPADPLFYSSITLRNVAGGSRYRITRHDTGAELAAGTVAGSGLVDATVSALPCFANPQQVDITVRKATSAPKYQPFDTSAFVTKSGADAFIAQVPDPIA